MGLQYRTKSKVDYALETQLTKFSNVSFCFDDFRILSICLKCCDENLRKIENEGHEENVEFVDLVKSLLTRIWSQTSASIQPRTN